MSDPSKIAQDSRASGQTGAMKLLAAKFAEILAPALDPRGPYVKVMIAKLAETAIAALSPPAIGDGEIMQELAAEYVNPESALRLLREGAMPAMQAKKVLAACARIAERAGASDRWQPIESVPAQYKDEGRELYVCRFGKETAPTYNVVFWDNNIGRWAFAEDMDRSYHPDFPTHWQLPEPPVALHTDEKKGG